MATTLTQDLDSIKAVEDKLTANQVAQFAYTQEAYNDPEHYADGVQAYDVNNPNNIPVADASILKVNETVLSKGYRSQASSITRMLLNHFLGRTSYNLNKANDLIKSLVTTIKANLGRANGFATLDANGRIPYSQLPESAIEFKGAWNAQTNTPTLADGTGTKGDFYVVSVAGTQNLGSGNIQFFVNDRVIYDGEVWQRLSAGDVKTVNDVQPVNGNITLTPADIELGNVNNTSDENKPVSTAQQEAINNAINTAENLANATGVLTVSHGGTGAQTPADARTQLGVDLELLKKANTIESISAVDTLALTANADVFIKDFVNAIIAKVPRDVQNSIVKFVTDSTKAVNIVFDSTIPLPPGAVKISSDGLIIIGNLVKMDNTTSNLDMSLIFLDKNMTFYTCRVVQNGSHVVTASISQSQASLTFDSTPTDNSSNPVTSSGIYNAIKSAIEALDVNSVGGAGEYIESISETDGKISATAQSMDNAPTANSTKAVTSDGVKNAIDSAVSTAEDLSNATGILSVAHGGTGTNSFDTVPTAGSNKPVTSDGIRTAINGRLPAVVNTGDSAVPEENGTSKFTTGGAFSFFQTENKNTWLGRIFGKMFGWRWSRKSATGTYSFAMTTKPLCLPNGLFIRGTSSGLIVLGQQNTIYLEGNYIRDLAIANARLLVGTSSGLYIAHKDLTNFTKVNLEYTHSLATIDKISVLDDTVIVESLDRLTSPGKMITSLHRCDKQSLDSSSTSTDYNHSWERILVNTVTNLSSTEIITTKVVKNTVSGTLFYCFGATGLEGGYVTVKAFRAVSESGSFTALSMSTQSYPPNKPFKNIVCPLDQDGALLLADTSLHYIKYVAPDGSICGSGHSISPEPGVDADCCIALSSGTFLIGTSTNVYFGKYISSLGLVSWRSLTKPNSQAPLFTNGVTVANLKRIDTPEALSKGQVLVSIEDDNGTETGIYRLDNVNSLNITSSSSTTDVVTKTRIYEPVNQTVDILECVQGVLLFLMWENGTPKIFHCFDVSSASLENNAVRAVYELTITDKLTYTAGTWVCSDSTGALIRSGYEEAVKAGLIPE